MVEKHTVVFIQVSTMLLGRTRESRDNVSGLMIGLSEGTMGWGCTNPAPEGYEEAPP